MLNYFNQKLRTIHRYPAVTLLCVTVLLGILILKNITKTTEHVHSISNEWSNVFTLLFIPGDLALIILLFLTVLLFGPTLEKIYGSVKFLLIYLLVGLIGGGYFHFFIHYLVKTTSIISVSGFLGVYFILILKRHHMLTIMDKVFFWLYFLILVILSFEMPRFPIIYMATGFIIGFVLSLIIKPQTFREFMKMRWGRSMGQSAIVLMAAFFILYSNKLVDWSNFIKGIPSQVDELKGKIDTQSIKSDNHVINATDSTGNSQVKEQFIEAKPIYKTGDGLYNSILQSITNKKDHVNLAVYNINSDMVFNTLKQVLNDHPEIFYFDYSSSKFWSDGVLQLGYKYSKSDIDILNKRINDAVQEIIGSELRGGQSDYDKAEAIHDYIVKNTAYDYKNYQNNTIPDQSYTIIGPLLLRTAVCEGYAKSMEFLLNKVGIESINVSGTANGGAHTWNKVKIDGNWYNLDSTWDDPVPDRPGSTSHKYFLITDDYLARDHHWEQRELPVANDMKYMKLATFRWGK